MGTTDKDISAAVDMSRSAVKSASNIYKLAHLAAAVNNESIADKDFMKGFRARHSIGDKQQAD